MNWVFKILNYCASYLTLIAALYSYHYMVIQIKNLWHTVCTAAVISTGESFKILGKTSNRTDTFNSVQIHAYISWLDAML